MKKILNKKWLRREYNRLVKSEYKVEKYQEKVLQEEAKKNAEEQGCDAYVEIPHFMTKSGNAEVIK